METGSKRLLPPPVARKLVDRPTSPILRSGNRVPIAARALYASTEDHSGRFMQENEVTLSLATLRQGGCRITVDWPRAQRTHLSFPTEEEAQRWMQRDSATWIAGHRKNKTARRA